MQVWGTSSSAYRSGIYGCFPGATSEPQQRLYSIDPVSAIATYSGVITPAGGYAAYGSMSLPPQWILQPRMTLDLSLIGGVAGDIVIRQLLMLEDMPGLH